MIETDAAGNDYSPGYDRVLVDPPCSDLGTLASRPDARWRKSPRLIERVSELQERILRSAAAALKPGGTLVYSTCTISLSENERQLEALQRESAELEIDPLGDAYPELASVHDPRFLQTLPDRDRTRRLLHRPDAQAGERMTPERGAELPRPNCPGCGEPWLRPDQPPGSLSLRLLPAPLRARLAVPELRRAPDDRPHALGRGHALPALR